MRSKHTNQSKFWTAISALSLLVALGVSVAVSSVSFASPSKDVNIYLFWGDGCPHCAKEKIFLEPYVERTDYATLKDYEIYYNASNQQRMIAASEALGLQVSGVPLTIVGDQTFVGYTDSVGEEIVSRIEYCSVNGCPDSVASIVGLTAETEPADESGEVAETIVDTQEVDQSANKSIDIPLLGTINVADFSLPLLTVIIGIVDGFNPCAMWALIFIISLLIGMHDRKRMWLYGGTFIATSAFVYLLFMAAWLNLFMFIGHILWIRIVIGALAIAIGAYYLNYYFRHKSGCEIVGGEKRRVAFAKIRNIVHEKNLLLGLGGIIVLAAAVNVVELACSAGLPVVYTGLLSSMSLSPLEYALYLLLYILFYMLDDLIVFFVAMTTLKAIGIDSKYTRAVRLLGGILMVVLGLLLIFAPGVLMFG